MKKSFLLFLSLFLWCCSTPRVVGPYRVVKAKTTKEVKTNQTAQPAQTAQMAQPVQQVQVPNPQEDIVNKTNVREETFSMVTISDVSKLKTYSVVVGSFSNGSNAKNLKSRLEPAYTPIIVINSSGMYRVLLVSCDTYEEAKKKVAEITYQFSDAWILLQKR
ncbi:MAG: SPOR domain-containing protein [Prevotellaceae bacterium]|jgi:cell division protein FtsN|nr:SPOR domain-containing protein [Prevotellaceae bacterium]